MNQMEVKSKHQLYLRIIKDNFSDKIEGLSDKQIYHKLFINFRGQGDSTKGYRLSQFGHDLFCSIFNSYTFDIKNFDDMNTYDYIFLDNKKTPFYINQTDKKITTFDVEFSVLLKLYDGDIKKMHSYEKNV